MGLDVSNAVEPGLFYFFTCIEGYMEEETN